MPDGWESAGITDITIPSDAGPADPRIYVGQNDPIAQSLSQDAAIVFYFAQDRAFILSVEQSGGPDDGQLHLWADAGLGNFHQLMDLDFDVTNNRVQMAMAAAGITQDVSFQVFANSIELQDSLTASKENSDVKIYGESMPRGFHARAGSNAILAGITVAAGETLCFATPGEDYIANRAYRVKMKGGVRTAAASALAQLRIRKTGLGGQDLGEYFRYPMTAAGSVVGTPGEHEFTVGATTVNASIALTIQANVNTIDHFATANSPREIIIEDCGEAAKYPLAPVLV